MYVCMQCIFFAQFLHSFVTLFIHELEWWFIIRLVALALLKIYPYRWIYPIAGIVGDYWFADREMIDWIIEVLMVNGHCLRLGTHINLDKCTSLLNPWRYILLFLGNCMGSLLLLNDGAALPLGETAIHSCFKLPNHMKILMHQDKYKLI